ncbi:hypothetical protein V2J09_022323 [Rumex salicifolius]
MRRSSIRGEFIVWDEDGDGEYEKSVKRRNSGETFKLDRHDDAFVGGEIDIGRVSGSGGPVGRSHIVGSDDLLGSQRDDLEREGLTTELGKGLERGTPVVGHAYPPCAAPFHRHLVDVASFSYEALITSYK